MMTSRRRLQGRPRPIKEARNLASEAAGFRRGATTGRAVPARARRQTAKARTNTGMENLPSMVALLLPILAILMPIAIVWIVFWYKARQRELDLQENLRLREFEHLQRLKELELEIEKARARDPGK